MTPQFMLRTLIAAWLLISIGFSSVAGNASAESGEALFYKAQVFYNNFRKDKAKTKYREHWIVCIEKFKEAHRKNPSGKLAPASLYMSGEIYLELYRKAGKKSDIREALDIFRRVVKRYPGSSYRKKADAVLAKYPGRRPVISATGTLKDRKNKSGSSVKKPRISKNSPAKSPDVGHEDYGTVTASRSGLPHKARKRIFAESKADYRASRHQPEADPVAGLIKKEVKTPPPPRKTYDAPPTLIDGLRFWSNPNYTRVVVDGNRTTPYVYEFLEENESYNKPKRLYIDFENSRLGKRFQKAVPIDDDLLIAARAAQHTPDEVRVVIDIKSFRTYKIFSLNNPFRTIIDLWGVSPAVTSGGRRPATPVQPRPAPVPQPGKAKGKDAPQIAVKDRDPSVTPHDLAKQLALGVRRIVIDPGHGGHDPGAPGYLKGVKEKDVVLSIARRLARRIRKELGCEVIMTRNTDRFLTLEERTAIANTRNADLFISIHCNAHKNRRAHGIETYFLNLATDDDAILVAARENATSRKNISDLQTILNDLMQNSKINESSKLAGYIQRSMYSHLKNRYSSIKNKGVKQAPFYVLLGAQMPSILVETSFISNKRECKRLIDGSYQENLCTSIISGIRKYIRDTSPTAFRNSGDASAG